ncbi:hypothetical protein [Deinococcus sp. S9]|uniref:hypothetical protein n=1 Tax=Deinococcus sp. S9 TaxID=2545754 RepID=UPI00105466F5|nr:hypothetical protein [Deinococcus sp. S9]TDE87339.1 hypothetical protein E0686_02265 [Deinococcus sp. S9]
MPLTPAEYEKIWQERLAAVPDERRDMDRQLTAHVQDEGAIRSLTPMLPQGMGEAMEWYTRIAKATELANRVSRPEIGADRKALFSDPTIRWTEIPGTLPRLNRVQPNLLRAMAVQDPLIQSILQNKKNRMIRHAKLVRGGIQAALEGAEGFDFYPTYKPRHEALTEQEEAERLALAQFVLDSGDRPRFAYDGRPNRDDLSRESFAQMLAIWVEQRYVLDAVAIEIVRTRNKRRISGLYAVDGGSIVRTDPASWPYQDTPESKANPQARYAQVFQNRIYTTFGSDDLYYHYANPRDALGMRGYGISETEMSIKLTTGILNVLTTNNALFDRNALPPGMLLLFGQINSNQLSEWQAEWDAYRLGAGGQWGLPALNIRDPQGKVDYLRLDGAPSEMVFSSYVSFLGAIRCAIFGVDASEMNLSSFGGNNSNLSSGKDLSTRAQETRIRSFLPDMQRVETMYNEILGPATGGRWQFGFTGLIKEEPKELWTRLERIATVDELRQVAGLKPLTGIVGGSLANSPAISQLALAAIKDGAVDTDGDGALSIKEVADGAKKDKSVPAGTKKEDAPAEK